MRLRFVYLLALALSACGSVPTSADAGDEIDAQAPEWLVEHIEPVSMGDFFHVAAHGSRIYFARASNGTDRFFKSYQTGPGGTVQDEMVMTDADNDFCACGYTSDIVAGQGSLFYFGNYGHAFDVPVRMWRPLSYPMQFVRGEAAVAVIGDFVHVVTGRGPVASGQTYIISQDLWDATSPPTYPVAVQRARGVSYNGRMYVLGGNDVNGGRVATFASWAPGDANWRVLPDLVDPGVDHAVGFRNQIWALSGSLFFRFDLASNQWLPEAIEAPLSDRGVPVVVADMINGEESLYVVESGAQTRFLRYNR